tara:strand:+ start:769 stop:1143 length:375 start_codon:yes stop_codon:yes gene_type:complete
MFDANRFLDHLKLQLRNVGVDMTHISKVEDKTERMHDNPKECYLILTHGHTRDYPKQGDWQPAYTVKGYAYPEERKFYLQMNEGNGDWNDVLWPNCHGMTPADKALRENGLLDYDGNEWEVIAE